MHQAGDNSRLVVRWVEIDLEGLAAIACKADFGRNPAADQHDMGQQAAERQLGAELLFEVPEVATGGQRLVHVLAEHILCHYAGLNVAVSLQKKRPRCQEFDFLSFLFFPFLITNPAQKQGQAHLLPELALGVDDQLASLITDALLKLHYGLVWLSPIPGTIHLVGLTIRAVAGVLLHQTYL